MLPSRKNLQVEQHGDEDISVLGDPFLLHQALSNIIQNSIDFSCDGGNITITSRIDAERLSLMVDDEGAGDSRLLP